MKLVILGNGFDLGNNLPTYYSDFFNYRFNQKKTIFDIIDKFLYQSIKSSFKENESKESVDRSDSIKAINTVNYIIDKIVDENLNFWDIYFWWLLKNLNTSNIWGWNNVEEEIRNFVSEINTESQLHFNNLDINSLFTFNRSLNKVPTPVQTYLNNIFINYNTIERVYILLNQYLIKRKGNKNLDLYTLVLEELISFESVFRDYISKIMSEIIFDNKIRKNKAKYFDNFLKIIDSTQESEYFLLNFNYTSFQNINLPDNESMNDFNNKIEFIRLKKQRRITEINVHGSFNKKVIFGVDQDGISANKKYYIFTKTYRKVSESKNLVSQPLPSSNFINEIIFYGHSLSDADYSYFQSIFDFYDLYNSNIKLSFKFSYFGEESLYWEIKHKQINQAINLVKKYGYSLSNLKKGENLIHKLLLENRINFEEILLSQIDTKDFREKYFSK